MTNAVTAGRPPGTAPTTPAQARRTWPRTAALGGALIVLGVLALSWSAGPQLLLAAAGVVAAVRGAMLLRSARAGQVARTGAVGGAVAVWFGVAAVLVALLSATATGWVLVAGVVVVPTVLAAAATGRAAAAAVGGALVVGAIAVGVTGGADGLLSTGRVAAAALVGVLGLAQLAAAAGLVRLARRPEPAAPAACAGCACSSGGCGAAALR
ncbi:hypothetical protein [Modestobacter sp. SYSU DS0290]